MVGHVLCCGTVVLRDDRILLVRQAPAERHGGTWSIPWGFVDDGESPEVAARREVAEEAGLDVEVVGLLGVQRTGDQLAVVFQAEAGPGEPRPDGRETDAARFVSATELTALPLETWCGWLAHRALCGDLTAVHSRPDNPYLLRHEWPGWI